MSNENENAVTVMEGNPFTPAKNTPAPASGNAMMTAEMQRQVAEIQAQFLMALHRPRMPHLAVDKMLLECQRKSLAVVSIYSFARGGSAIEGLSIRALEMVARNWGNIKYGFRVLERRPAGGAKAGTSLLQAYAYDLESNVPVERVFEIKHWRDTKGGGYAITDERDIYELEANQAQRRVRACIEALIPGDVQESVEAAFRKTLAAEADVTIEGIKKMLEIFAEYGVNQAMIEARIQRSVTTMEPGQWVGLRTVYNSLKSGMAAPEAFFDMTLGETQNKEGTKQPDLKAAAESKKVEKAKNDKAASEDKAKADQKPAEQPPAATSETVQEDAPPRDLLEVERTIRDFAKAAKTGQELADAIEDKFSADLAEIKAKSPSAYGQLHTYLNDRMDKLNG